VFAACSILLTQPQAAQPSRGDLRGVTQTTNRNGKVNAAQRKAIGERIRELRDRSEHTNRTIAHACAVGERSVRNWTSGESGISWAHVERLGELFDVDPLYIWTGRADSGRVSIHERLDAIEVALSAIARALERHEWIEVEEEALTSAPTTAQPPASPRSRNKQSSAET